MAHQSWYTGDATAGTWEQDFSPLVLQPPIGGGDITLWGAVGKLADGTEPTKFEWVVEENTQLTITGTEGSGDGWNDTTDTTFEFTSGELAKAGARPGMMFIDATDRTKKEVIITSSVDSATQLTVIRDYGGHVSGSGGGTTGEVHSETCTFEIIGYLNWEGSSITKSDYFAKRDRDLDYNYYSLLDDWTLISASDLVREYRGAHPDNWGYQVQGLVTRLDRIFERHLLYSPQVARAGAARGSMGGLMWYARLAAAATAGSYVTTAVDPFTYETWDDGVKYLWQKNGDRQPSLITVMGMDAAQTIPYIHESAMRMEYRTENIRGMYANTLQSTITNQRVPILVSEVFPSSAFMIINLDAIRVHFLEGRALVVYSKEVGEGLDDFRGARYLSEMTLEVQRPTENIYFHTGVTFRR